ncbi:cryptochrome/photolyase family protein [Kineosporia sp. J2-2]|uniref:Cryptochrome/photolyase family protein n=1 Tax=Kineosporia corallincola TaxID=2835133 RepID=A0ABS5TMS0_9ACTN|nr:cryptochrome/photolyase family protein [Kineosporia corallincola]
MRWLFADQLGPHFLDADDQPVLLIESLEVFRRRRFHRRKAHLVLSALRHRAAELGGQAVLRRAGTYTEALDGLPQRLRHRPLSVCAPTTYAARRLVERLPVEVLPSRGYAISEEQFAGWARRRGGRKLLMEDFYRDVRRHHRLLLEGDGEPVGGRWNHDHDNREPPPKAATLARATGLPDPWWPAEDEIDEQVRADLDRWEREEGVTFLGEDGPRRFAVTRDEALRALESFVTTRLDDFGPYEDAILAQDRWMAHSLLSVPLNLGLLHPVEVARRAERAYRDGDAGPASTEGFVRQVTGWRDYVWHVYWHFGDDYRRRNHLAARRKLPRWFAELDPDGEVEARCLSNALTSVREDGWAHHIPRLMVLGNWALQRGYDPVAVTDWFHRAFVDGYDWVMVPNVVGMALHADGGSMMTKPYAAGGAYINRMSDHCGGCRYDPKKRVGEDACPFTAGYWAFLERHREQFAGNHRMSRAYAGMGRLKDLEEVLEQERLRGAGAP